MSLKSYARKLLSEVVKPYGYEIKETEELYEWQKSAESKINYNESSRLPENAAEYLRIDNTRLLELEQRYADFDEKVTTPLIWKDEHLRSEDILYFRGDNAYVWQLKGLNMNILTYALTTFYVKSIDKLDLLEKLKEDNYFGNYTFDIDGKTISRDLLDSIIEIYFLDKHLDISTPEKSFNILDIGAGYGRLANRVLNALPNVKNYFCTDGVAASTFISEYYLKFRGLEDRAKVIALDNIEETLKDQEIDIAINVHSFSECQISAIDWWISLLAKNKIKHLMIAPNDSGESGKTLMTNDRKDFKPIVEKYGYKLIANEPKFRDAVVQKYGLNPTHHFLFELQ